MTKDENKELVNFIAQRGTKSPDEQKRYEYLLTKSIDQSSMGMARMIDGNGIIRFVLMVAKILAKITNRVR